jgi:hypothetical protein
MRRSGLQISTSWPASSPGSLRQSATLLACLPAMRRSVRRRLTQSALPVTADVSAAKERVAPYLAGWAEIRQFLDVRVGARPSAQLAWMTCPKSRIFYVADSPVRLPPGSTAGLPARNAIDYATADPRGPDMILMASISTLDFTQPIAVLLRRLLSHVSDHDDA